MPDIPNTAEPQKPRRRWFQFRLRTLLITVAIVGSLIGPMRYVAQQAKIVHNRKTWLVAHSENSISYERQVETCHGGVLFTRGDGKPRAITSEIMAWRRATGVDMC